MIARLALGAALAAIVALLARRAGALSPSGTLAAALAGALAVAAGWSWAVLLLAFFVPATLLSRWRRDRKSARTAAIVEKGGNRDAFQVLANGGVFAACALGQLLLPNAAPWWILAAGSLAAAASDTWATETGTALGGTPRRIVDGRPLAAGESGGITAVGTAGGFAGAALAAIAAVLATFGEETRPVALGIAIATGGVGGMLADSLLGATVQARRWCTGCAAYTERRVHPCGTPTVHAHGASWLGNDAVNLLATLTGATVSLTVARAMGLV